MGEGPLPAVSALPHVASGDVAAMIVPARTALVVVDVQVDFVSQQGLAGTFGVDLAPVERAVDRIEDMIAAARAAGVAVAFLRVVTRPETDSQALKLLMARRGMPGGEAICRAGSGGEDYYRLFPQPGDIEVEKRLYDGFHDTDFDARLRGQGIDTLVMTGATTECCVDSTARTAFHLGYNVLLASDACAAYDDSLHIGALHALQLSFGLLTTCDDVIAAWA